MPAQDTTQIKDKIVSFIRTNGPSLPVHIASKIENSILFTSAFLSELLSEKRIKISNMRVGSSPLYLLEGQEPQLEKFSQYLKSKEKEAFLLLKEKRFLKDALQQPAIRVALRDIRDFAIPFRYNKDGDEIWWRYFTTPESELSLPKKVEPEAPTETEQKPKEETVPEKPAPKKDEELGIFDKSEEKNKKQVKAKPKTQKKKSSKKKSASNEKFFNDVKRFLEKNEMNLKDIINFSKNEIVLLIEDAGSEKILVAFNKNKIGEKEIAKASKKSREFELPYIAMGKTGVLKKIESLIEDLRNLDSIKSLNN